MLLAFYIITPKNIDIYNKICDRYCIVKYVTDIVLYSCQANYAVVQIGGEFTKSKQTL